MNTKTLAALSAITLLLCACTREYGYRNIAHFRAAYQSSCADFDQAAQLVTDGIVAAQAPDFAFITINGTEVPKHKKEWIMDWSRGSSFLVDSCDVDLIYHAGNCALETDGSLLQFQVLHPAEDDADLPYTVDSYVLDENGAWVQTAKEKGVSHYCSGTWVGAEHQLSYGRAYAAGEVRFVLHCPGAVALKICSWVQKLDGENLYPLDKVGFTSAWVSQTSQNEWVYVDLGGVSRFDRIVLDWLNRPESGRVLVSDDSQSWKELCSLDGGDSLEVVGKGRYVKVEMDSTADGKPFILSEMQVLGHNAVKMPQSDWMVARESEVDDLDAWLPANVPGTVLSSYIDAGAVPDITYSDYIHNVSQSYFRSNFIYRGTMKAPEVMDGKVWMDFDGINWKADVRLNGTSLGHIDGAFTSARFDVTDIIRPGDNDVEVKIYSQDHMGIGRQNTRERNAYNGGVLGADNPTFHASIGWDWMPSVPGREIGIWNDVYFTTTGSVTVEDPYVRSLVNLPDTTHADVTVSAILKNHGTEAVVVDFSAALAPVGADFSRAESIKKSETVELAPGQSVEVESVFSIDNPRLWWPNGYGEQNLYDVAISAVVNERQSDSRMFQAGIRQMTYDTSDGSLKLFVNGRRFVARGGNWGFSEVNLRYDQHDYDVAVGYHAMQNFTMIRNWVGQTGDDEFYRSCDRYGIMVWQDFWLANPGDGPNPVDEDMFMDNADNYVRRIRNHPCIALYCGRNEGNPPASLDAALRGLVADKTDIVYISHSSRGLVSGEGRYWRLTTPEFFMLRGNDKLHSERGMPNMMNYESLVSFMPESQSWPIGQQWAEHDWSIESAQRSEWFTRALETMFGPAPDAKTYTEWAQWVNYDGYRAMFEGRSKNRRGLLLWMSHSAWPSLVWSTYDYWFDPTASFFGAKKACEPLHIQWNAATRKVEVVNVSAGNHPQLYAEAQILDMYGNILSSESAVLDSGEDTTVELMELNAPQGQEVFYIRLFLSWNDALLSSNFYVQGAQIDDFKTLRTLPRAKLTVGSKTRRDGDRYVIDLTLKNVSETPAMMIRLQPLSGGRRVLPYDAQDNYFHLMPGETRRLSVSMAVSDCKSRPAVKVEGFNL